MYIGRYLILLSFDQMHKYLHVTKSAIDEEQERFFATIKEIHSTYTDENQKQGVLDLLDDEFTEVTYEFPRMLYSSFLVTWYSFIEHKLLQLCDDLNLTINITIRERDEFGTGIQRARKFLKEAANYEIPDEYWQELTKIRQIRNKIVHEGGEIKYFATEQTDVKTIPLSLETISIYAEDFEILYLQIETNLFQYLDEHALLKYEGEVYIDPTFDYCLGLIDFGKGLFTRIWDNLDLK